MYLLEVFLSHELKRLCGGGEDRRSVYQMLIEEVPKMGSEGQRQELKVLRRDVVELTVDHQ
jgi:hypothetical protein